MDAATTRYPSERELIVVASVDAQIRATPDAINSMGGVDTAGLTEILSEHGASMVPLFGETEDRLTSAVPSEAFEGLMAPHPAVYYRVQAVDDELDTLAESLRAHEAVEAAYVKPPAQPASVMEDVKALTETPPVTTPDFSSHQGYLDAAPAGVDARWAWTQPGGAGASVRIIDVEGAWRFSHEDLSQNQGGAAGGTPTADLGWRNHGTAVIGEFGGDRNTIGVTGISPDANVRGVSIFGNTGSAGAIRQAADLLGPGDIILIELHRPGPRATGVGQQGFIAVEWWPDDFDAIRYATNKGVIVVEAAGNGAENLDDAAYDNPQAGFPAWWTNPFRRSVLDSRAVLVGAGAPPPGTHGRDWGPDRSRLDFSNWGSSLDAQGWGREVTSSGYGDLQGGLIEDVWYTDQFSGTSSASPIVVGSIGSVQGFLRAQGMALLTPPSARQLLRTTGSPQQDAPGRPANQRIGNRPDIRQMIGRFVSVTTAPLYRYWNPSIGDHFYTTNWAELGGGNYGWGFEGIQCYLWSHQVPGSIPLYRYWNPGIGDHFYTTSWAELGFGGYGWSLEGLQGYAMSAQQPGTVPLYRYWNPTATDHFYTTNWAELGGGNFGWGFEGIQCFVPVSPQTPDASSPSDRGSLASLSRNGTPAPETSEIEDLTGDGSSAWPATFATPGAAMQTIATGIHPGPSFSLAPQVHESVPPATFRTDRVEGQGMQPFRTEALSRDPGQSRRGSRTPGKVVVTIETAENADGSIS